MAGVMASIRAKSEFMENAFPAGQLKLKGKFAVAQDQAGEHMIFTVSDQGKFYLIIKGQDGHNEIVNLSDKLNLASAQSVSAFAVSQNKDGSIHLALAVRQPNGLDKLLVLKPMTAIQKDWQTSLSPSDLYSGDQWDIRISEILLGSSNDARGGLTQYPQIHIVFQHQNKTTDDIWALTVDVEKKLWTNAKTFQMPKNVLRVIDKCPANLKLYRGLFVLSEEDLGMGRTTTLRFIGFDPTKQNPTLQAIDHPVPPGASQIASIEDDSGFTELLVAGKENLSWRNAQDCLFPPEKKPLQVISTDPALDNLVQTYLAQTKDSFAIWLLRRDGLLSYQEFLIGPNATEPQVRTEVVPLLSRGSDRFAALQHPRLGQKLFLMDPENHMHMLEQTNQTGLWQQPVEVMIPQSDQVIEFKSHTVHVEMTEEQTGKPLSNTRVKLRVTTTQEFLLNGVSMSNTAEGKIVSTDEAGIVTIIVRNDGLETPLLYLEDPDSKTSIIPNGSFKIDPMSKVWSTIGELKTASDLRNMKLPDNTNLVRDDIADKDLEAAAKALQDLDSARVNISMTPRDDSALEIHTQSILDRIWGAFRWVADKIKEGAKWFVRKVGEAWQFVVDIAGKVWEFVLKTASQVAAAMQKVLEAISKGWEWIKKKFEFLFSWGDIVDVKNALVNVTTQGLLYGVDTIDLLEQKADSYFEDIKSRVRKLRSSQGNLPSGLKSIKAGNDPEVFKETKGKPGTAETEESSKSPAAEYGNYHIKHSGNTLQSGNSPLDKLHPVLERLRSIWDSLQTLLQRFGTNISELFSNSNKNFQDVIEKLAMELLEDLITVAQKLVKALLGSLAQLLLELTDSMNKPIQIPVLSYLYKKVSGGTDLTILDLFCLLLAIPGTIVFKFATGKRPKELPDIEPLLVPNAHRKELDDRMNQIRMLSSASPEDIEFAKANNDVSKLDYKRDRFARSGSIIGIIVKFVVPVGKQIWYTFVTWPSLFKAPKGYGESKWDTFKAVGSGVLWILAGIPVFQQDYEDPWANHRLWIWLPGFLEAIGRLTGGDIGEHALTLLAAVLSNVMLAWLHIEAWTKMEGGYSIYLCVEEWAKGVANMANPFSGLTKGGYGYGAIIAASFTTIGNVMELFRVVLETAGKREVLTSGMSLMV